MKISTRTIAYLGVLSAVSVLLNALTWTVPGSAYAISFTYVPTFLAGYFFGPASGFAVGLIGDVLGCIIWPKGAWLPLITLASAMMGVIPGLLRKIPVNETLRIGFIFIVTYIVCSAGINTFALWQAFAATSKTFWVYLFGRMPLQALNLLVNMIITAITFPLFKKILANGTSNKKTEEDVQSEVEVASQEK